MNTEITARDELYRADDVKTSKLCLLELEPDPGSDNRPTADAISMQYVDSIARNENPTLSLRMSKQISNDKTENGSYFVAPQKYMRTQCEFTPAVENFLNRYSRRYPPQIHADGGKTYTVPIYGITNRSVESSDDFSPKFFKSSMHITVPKGAHNFDQCTITRGPREKLTNEEYRTGVQQELYGWHDLLPQSGPLSFFTHGVFAGAGQSDDDVLRVAAESGVPTINVDWRSTPGNIFTKVIRYGIDFSGAINQEPSFEPYLDQTVEWLNPRRCAFIAFSRGSAFNAAYMKHRHDGISSPERKLNGVLFAHPDLETEKFRVRDEFGLNPITSSAENTIVLGSPKDKALMFASRWLRGDRVGDAGKQDIDAVIKAGGRYLIDEFPKRGNNFHHFINYRSLGGMVRELLHPARKCIAADPPEPPSAKLESSPPANWRWIEPTEAARYK